MLKVVCLVEHTLGEVLITNLVEIHAEMSANKCECFK